MTPAVDKMQWITIFTHHTTCHIIHHSGLLFSVRMVRAVCSFNILTTTWDDTWCYSPKDDCKWIRWFVLWDGNFPVAHVFILETWEDRSYSVTFFMIRIIPCCTVIETLCPAIVMGKKVFLTWQNFFLCIKFFFFLQCRAYH